MDGYALDMLPTDAIAPSLGDLIAGLAPAPLIAIALVTLIVVAGIDAVRPDRGVRR